MGDYCYSLRNGTIITTFEEHPWGEILDRLTAIAAEEGFPLTEEVIAKYDEAPATGSIRKYVGDIEQANKWVGKRLEKAGLLKGAIKMGGKRRTEEQLLKDYYDLWVKLGKIPNATDIEQAAVDGECASKSSYAMRFGGLTNTRELVIKKYGQPFPLVPPVSGKEETPVANMLAAETTKEISHEDSAETPAETSKEAISELPKGSLSEILAEAPVVEPTTKQENTVVPKATISIKILIPGLSEPITMEIAIK